MKLASWISLTDHRIYPSTESAPSFTGPLVVARNERFSLQLSLRTDAVDPIEATAEVAAPASWTVRIRRVGYVPVRHLNTGGFNDPGELEGADKIPGFVPDPLFDEVKVLLPHKETHSFWLTFVPAPDAAPGDYPVEITAKLKDGTESKHSVIVTLAPIGLKKRHGFSITHWFYVDALIDWYKTDLFDEKFWAILPAYLENIVDHGQDTLYVPIFTPPLDGVKRPSQLLKVHRSGSNGYEFDWSDVRRYVNAARQAGIERFEWCHLFTQWGVKFALRIYEGQGRDEKLLWPPETGATSDTYRAFLSQFLAEFKTFLDQENLLEKSLFHLSDEPHGAEHLANYRQARALLSELAPWLKVMDALSEIEFAKAGLTDLPVPSIQTALSFHQAGIPAWCYYCCGPRGKFLNRLLDTPLAKIGMHGLLFYRWPFQGFLHWGYNYWQKSQTRDLLDPFHVQDGTSWPNWAFGDTFVVYPGPAGPIDSIRWEIFAESLQDYQILQTLNIRRDDPLLEAIKSFEEFPKHASWRRAIRARLLAVPETKTEDRGRRQ